MNRIITTAALIVLPLFTFAQYTPEQLQKIINTSSENQLVTENSQMLQDGYLYQSILVADKLLEINSESSNYNYRKGFALLEMSGDFIKALPYLEIAVKNVKKNYDMFSANEKSASTDALYHLARCYHLAENIDKAEEYYNKFIEASNSKSEFVFFSKLRLQQCAVARKLLENPKKMQLQNIGAAINTIQPEYSPVVSLDGSALYFTSRRPWYNGASDKGIDPRYNLHPEDIYVSYRDFDETWTNPVRLEFCDSIQNEATLAVSSDERRIYVYEDTEGNGDIFYSDFSTNRFQDVSHLRIRDVNTNSWETHCTVTPDGLTMYFVSDRKGGFGGRDIYRVIKLPDGNWSEPINVGPKINGPMDEESPFIAVDNKTLYFSSNGSKSMGGFDVFVSVMDEDKTWSDPINLGYPLNSTGDDLFYTTTVDGLTGYLTSFRKNGYGEKDIYEVQNDELGMKNLAILKGKVSTVGNKPLPEDISITLRCTNCGDSFDRKVFPRVRDGVFLSSLEPCRQYEMIFSYEDGKKEFYKEAFTTDCNKEYEEIYREVLLDVERQQMVSKPVYYLTGTVHDSQTKQVIKDAKVTISYKEGGNVGDYTTNAEGSYKSGTLLGKKYEDKFGIVVKIEKEGYVTMTYELPVELGPEARIDLDTYISPELTAVVAGIDLGAVVDVQPIYFDYNKWDIRPDAKIELDKIVKAMKDNPGITIELGSHTDSRGSANANMLLSDRRAKSSAAYIVSQGISAERIIGKGYGKSMLIISDADINKMKTRAEKEAGHQKNRRTEFIVK